MAQIYVPPDDGFDTATQMALTGRFVKDRNGVMKRQDIVIQMGGGSCAEDMWYDEGYDPR